MQEGTLVMETALNNGQFIVEKFSTETVTLVAVNTGSPDCARNISELLGGSPVIATPNMSTEEATLGNQWGIQHGDKLIRPGELVHVETYRKRTGELTSTSILTKLAPEVLMQLYEASIITKNEVRLGLRLASE